MPDQPPIQRPATPEALAEALKNVANQGLSVRVTGSNSLPLTVFQNSAAPAQTIATIRLNKIIEHAVPDMTVIVQAGITLESLQKELVWRNQWLPIDPPIISENRSPPGTRTLGGLIASNSLGPLRFGIGDWRTLILGMKWLDAAGTPIKGGGRTVKNVAGYSFPRLLVGSCGSLGIITEITLRTYARPEDERSIVAYCPTAAAAENLLAEILISPTIPAYLQVIGKSAFAGNLLDLPPANDGMIVLTGFLGRAEVCAAQVDILRTLKATAGLETISLTAAQSGRLRQWMTTEPALEGPGAGFRLHVKSSQVTAAIEQLEALAAQSNAPAWLVSEAGTGLIRGTLTGENLAPSLQKIASTLSAILTFTQGVPLSPKKDPLYAAIKREMDPDNRFGNAPE